jgi:large subunit ribosomal protein L10
VRGGILQDSLVDAAGVKALASLPSRDVLIAQVIGTMAAPMTGLVTVLQGTIGGFVRALGQVAEQKAAAGEA